MARLKLYNFLTRKKEAFKPLKKKVVGFYACGPTVYDRAHLGNMRTYIFEDVLHRALAMNGLKVRRVTNITDIDDKIIKRAAQEKKSISKITGIYAKLFFEDLKNLNIKKADFYPRATKFIKEMLALIAKLVNKKFAYKSGGSVYFDISKFKNYGRLSMLAEKTPKPDARVERDEYGKEDVSDFALWKAAKPGEPFWDSQFGKGRPGWHLECSAMSMKYLGSSFDIHAGAVDLLFPHHENEIAQSEAATGKKFVNFWVEGEHLLANGEKMSKSLGNFFTLADLEKRGFDPLSFRYLVLTSHYRSQLNFTWESLQAAENALEKIYDFIKDAPTAHPAKPPMLNKMLEGFQKAINDDLDTPKALAIMWKAIRGKKISQDAKKFLLLEFDKIFGLSLEKAGESKIKVPLKIKKLIEERKKLRSLKKWGEADLLREEAQKLGWFIEDTPDGPKIRKV